MKNKENQEKKKKELAKKNFLYFAQPLLIMKI